jgi:hypothetical protein
MQWMAMVISDHRCGMRCGRVMPTVIRSLISTSVRHGNEEVGRFTSISMAGAKGG